MTSPDSLAVICAELHAIAASYITSGDATQRIQGRWTDLAYRIERLDAEMRKELDSKVFTGSGNVFRDLELPDPECRQQLADANIELADLRAKLAMYGEALAKAGVSPPTDPPACPAAASPHAR